MESTTVDTDRTWPLGIRVRPPVDPDAGYVEVADTVAGRRFRWSPDALCAHILRGSDPTTVEADADRVALEPGWRHWQERGWYPSDQYYVASRGWRFADADDHDRSVRGRVLDGYLAAEGPPVADALPDGTRVPLPDPTRPVGRSLDELLVTRRSGRAYVPDPVPAGWLSGLLWYGLTQIRKRRERTGTDRPLSYLDSFGSAWDLHVCVFAVDGVAPGAYRYDIRRHELIEVRPGEH